MPNGTTDRVALVQKYVADARAKGYSDDQIRDALVKSGVDGNTISSLMGAAVKAKPFYKQWWFYVPSALVVVFLGLLLAFIISEQLAPEEALVPEEEEEERVRVTLEEEEEEVVTEAVEECSTDDDCQLVYGDDYVCEEGSCVEESGAEPICGDGRCDIGEYGACSGDCPCESDDDCGSGYECTSDGECEEESYGGGGGGGSSSSEDDEVSSSTSCSDSDCGEYVCESSSGCYSSCTYGGDSSECASGYACSSGDACGLDCDGSDVADEDEGLTCDACTEDSECDSGYICAYNGYCMVDEDTDGVADANEVACNDGDDNDEDDRTDYLGGCDTTGDTKSEYNCLGLDLFTPVLCRNYCVNTLGGTYIVPDRGCGRRGDTNEEPTCHDEEDNDDDGFVDYLGLCMDANGDVVDCVAEGIFSPRVCAIYCNESVTGSTYVRGDPQCDSIRDMNERNVCNDGIDNDHDNRTDYLGSCFNATGSFDCLDAPLTNGSYGTFRRPQACQAWCETNVTDYNYTLPDRQCSALNDTTERASVRTCRTDADCGAYLCDETNGVCYDTCGESYGCSGSYACLVTLADWIEVINTDSFSSRCVTEPSACTDSDGGDDPQTPGTTDGEFIWTNDAGEAYDYTGEFSDFCYSSSYSGLDVCDSDAETCDSVIEFSCGDDGYMDFTIAMCDEGYSCAEDADGVGYCAAEVAEAVGVETECSDFTDDDSDGTIDTNGGCDLENDGDLDYYCGCFLLATQEFSSYFDCTNPDLVACTLDNCEVTGDASTDELYGCYNRVTSTFEPATTCTLVADATATTYTYYESDTDCAVAEVACTDTLPTCADGVDNDQDGTIDYRDGAGDSDCTEWASDDEVYAAAAEEETCSTEEDCDLGSECSSGMCAEMVCDTAFTLDVGNATVYIADNGSRYQLRYVKQLDDGSGVRIQVFAQQEAIATGDTAVVRGLTLYVASHTETEVTLILPCSGAGCLDDIDCAGYKCDTSSSTCYDSCTESIGCAEGYACEFTFDLWQEVFAGGTFTSSCVEGPSACDDSVDAGQEPATSGTTYGMYQNPSGTELLNYSWEQDDICYDSSSTSPEECDSDAGTCDSVLEFYCDSDDFITFEGTECSDVGTDYTCLTDSDGRAYCGVATAPECADGDDNDGDYLYDYYGACYDSSSSESSVCEGATDYTSCEDYCTASGLSYLPPDYDTCSSESDADE